jgi:hypothetical protein
MRKWVTLSVEPTTRAIAVFAASRRKESVADFVGRAVRLQSMKDSRERRHARRPSDDGPAESVESVESGSTPSARIDGPRS